MLILVHLFGFSFILSVRPMHLSTMIISDIGGIHARLYNSSFDTFIGQYTFIIRRRHVCTTLHLTLPVYIYHSS